jgi:hypothetical protein
MPGPGEALVIGAILAVFIVAWIFVRKATRKP